MTSVEIVCNVMRNYPDAHSIAIADGTQETNSGDSIREREKWFFIPHSKIIDCDPPLDALPTSGPRMVTLTIPEWLALDRGLI